MNKKIVWGLGIIIFAGIAWYVWGGAGQNAANTSVSFGQDVSFEWVFTDAGEDVAIGANKTTVTLSVGGKNYDAGTYLGSCNEIGESGGIDGTGLLSGELSGVQCWFAGGGDEVGVFSVGDSMVLQRGQLGEPQEGIEAFRGNFETILTIGQ